MRLCKHCHGELSPLARFCGQCGKETGFDLPVLKQYAKRPLAEKTETSLKRKSLGLASFILFVSVFIFINLLIAVSFSLGYNLAGIMFTVAGFAFIFYFVTQARHLKNLIKRDLNHHCPVCGTRFLKGEKYCQLCGGKL